MKRLAFRITSMLLTFILLGVSETFAQTYERTFSFTFTKEDIEISKSGEGYYVRPNKVEILWSYLDEAPNKPAFPYLRYYILLPDNYKVKSFNHSVEDEMWYDGEYTLNAVPLPIPTGEGNMNKEDDSPYPLVTYPAEVICYEETLMDGYRTAHFLINPFTYHADTKKLGLAANMNLDITIEPVDKDEEVNRPKDPASVKSWVYNPEDVDMGAENWTLVSTETADVHSFVNESKLWHCKKWKQAFLGQEDRYYYFQGDTVINGITAKKMYLKFSKESDKGNYQAALYEEGQKVYCCYPNQKGFELEYDFGAKKGEKVTTSSFTYMVEDVEEMKVGDETLRVLHLYILHDLLNEKYSVTWVEGVGAESAPCYSGPNFPGGYEYFIDCEIDGKVFLKAEDIPNHITPTQKDDVRISSVGQTLFCTSPTAVKLEVYTMDAIKVGEAAFANGEASVKVRKTPATYLYIVTYPDGRRESGKVVVKD